MKDLDDSIISPISYLKIFFRRKELIIIPLFAGLIFGICAGILLPKQYKTSTTILVQEGKSDNPLFSQLAVSTTVRQRMAGIRESILGWNSLVELVKRLNLDQTVKTKQEFEQLILGLRGTIFIRLRGNNIIYLEHVGAEPEKVQAVVSNITDIFIEKNVEMQNRETSDAISFIEEQLEVYKGKIKSAEIAELQEQLDSLRIDSTEKHPLVRQIQEQIGVKRKELEAENLKFTKTENLTTQTTNPIISEIKKALDTIEVEQSTEPASQENDLYKVMILDKLDTVMARDVRVNEQIYNMLLQRLETAKITQRLQSSKEGTRYTILDAPRVPLRAFKPNKALVAFVGLVFGGIFGAALVFAMEFLDKSFLDVEEAKKFLGSPLLGAISKINTPETLRRERERYRWMYSMTLIAGTVVIIVTVTLSNLLK